MKTSDFYYDLPEELIAQTPLEPRDSSRLMILHKKTGEIEHRHFYDILDYLNEGDCLIMNDSRVLPARIYGVKDETNANVEFLLLNCIEGKKWEALAKPGKRAKIGTSFSFGDGLMHCKVIDILDDGNRILEFECEGSFYENLDKLGQMPLPPYIHEKLKDKERYQTVYSREIGSAAAPTARWRPSALPSRYSAGSASRCLRWHARFPTCCRAISAFTASSTSCIPSCASSACSGYTATGPRRTPHT